MKKLIAITLALALLLLSSCGKSRSEELMDRYTEVANTYTSLASSVAGSGDNAVLGRFSSLGIELTDLAGTLAKDGDALTEEELDGISASLDKIEAALSEFAGDEAE